jgi:hypothetical protein
MGDKLVELAAEDEAKGRAFSASAKLERASLYLLAERMQGHGAPGRKETYAKARDALTVHRAGQDQPRAGGNPAEHRHDAGALHPWRRRRAAPGGGLLQWPR